MNERLFGYRHAFDHAVTVWIVVAAALLLVAAPVVFAFVERVRRMATETRSELRTRYWSWLVLAPLMVVPILLGAFWTICFLLLLALFCYREFARLTGLFRERLVSLVVVLGTLLVFLAALDHWYGLFVAAFPLTVGAIAVAGLLRDEPRGYIQRVALGVLGFALCGVGLGHLAYFANDVDYRPILLMLIVAIQLNDVFAYCTGKLFGRAKMMPNTSPGKTWGGSMGSIVLTTPLVATIGHFAFSDTVMDDWSRLLGLGILVAVLGQLGDLMLSAIKRDVGVKDTGHLIPGHGGLLDRFDSTLLVAPAAFHYLGYFLGIGLDQETRIVTRYLSQLLAG